MKKCRSIDVNIKEKLRNGILRRSWPFETHCCSLLLSRFGVAEIAVKCGRRSLKFTPPLNAAAAVFSGANDGTHAPSLCATRTHARTRQKTTAGRCCCCCCCSCSGFCGPGTSAVSTFIAIITHCGSFSRLVSPPFFTRKKITQKPNFYPKAVV